MKKLIYCFSLLALFFAVPAFAGVESPAFWDGLADKIPGGQGTIVLIMGGLLDMVMRYIKTEKPISVLRMIAVILAGVAKIADKGAKLLDAILGQRAEKPADPVVPAKAE